MGVLTQSRPEDGNWARRFAQCLLKEEVQFRSRKGLKTPSEVGRGKPKMGRRGLLGGVRGRQGKKNISRGDIRTIAKGGRKIASSFRGKKLEKCVNLRSFFSGGQVRNPGKKKVRGEMRIREMEEREKEKEEGGRLVDSL